MSEWELRVSQKEIHRLHLVRLTVEGRKQFGRGAKLLGIFPRQMKWLGCKMKERGVEGLLHGNRGEAACGAGHDCFHCGYVYRGSKKCPVMATHFPAGDIVETCLHDFAKEKNFFFDAGLSIV